MGELFYRWHQDQAPAFSAANAWSATWGSEFTPDGSAYTCTCCEGTGEQAPEVHEACDGQGCRHCDDGIATECADCAGEGTIGCDRGYSCCASAADLISYFSARYVTAAEMDRDGTVYVFEGEFVGNGTEGEPLAVPERVVEALTWSDLVARERALPTDTDNY